MNDRVMPHADDTERSVLCSCILPGRSIVASAMNTGINVDDFYIGPHRMIWMAIASIWDNGDDPDIETVVDHLLSQGQLDQCGGTPYLSSLLGASSSPNLGPWVTILKQYTLRRKMIAAGTHMVENAYNYEISTAEVEQRAEEAIYEMSGGAKASRPKYLKELLPEFFERVKGYMSGVSMGIKSGFSGIDQSTGGFMPSDMIVLAGRPSMGKSSAALSFGINAAQAAKNVIFFSIETIRSQIFERAMCMQAGIEMAKLRAGTVPQRDLPAFDAASGQLGDLPMRIDDTPALTVSQIRSTLMRASAVDMIIVDYLQLMEGPGTAGNEKVENLARGLKTIAKEFDIPVIVLSQLSRAVEQRGGDKEPVLSDLRGSGSIEQDADVVMFVYRKEYYFRDDESLKGKGKIIIAKQRNGPTGWVALEWQAAFARFVNPKYGEPTPGWEDDV